MKQISFDYHSRAITISDETYKKVLKIVNAEKICSHCGGGYTEESPCVALNTCLNCLLKKQQHNNLTFLREQEKSNSEYKNFLFINQKGEVFVSSTYSDNVERSQTETLKHWGFSYPEFYNGDTNRLHGIYWSISGDFTKNKVILIQNRFDFYASGGYKNKYVTYFAFKNGSYLEVNKRKKEVKRLFTQAQELLEQTKDSKGYYHYKGREQSWISDYVLNEIVSDLASSENFQG